MTSSPDPFHSVACDLLGVLAEAGTAMTLCDLEGSGLLAPQEAARQLSVARVAGFVRTVADERRPLEPCYRPTTLGLMIGRRAARARVVAAVA